MANKVITMQQIRSIIQLLEKGYSLRSISAQIGLSRQPVTFYAARLKNAPYCLEALRQLSDEDLASIVYAPAVTTPLPESARRQELEALMPYFLSELKRTGVTRLLLWEEYRKQSADPFRYTQFCILLKQAGKLTNASMHLRYCGEGYITTNLIEIESTDPSSPYPEYLYFNLIERDVQEEDYLPIQQANRISNDTKNQIIEFILEGNGTQEQAAERFLGKKSLKGTVSKIMKKHQVINN